MLWSSVAQCLGQKLVQWHFKDWESRSSYLALRWTYCLGKTWVPVTALVNVQMNCTDWKQQKTEFSGLGPFQCYWVKGGYFKDGKPRLKLLPDTNSRIWTWFCACVGNACTAGWHWHFPSQMQWLASWLKKEGMAALGSSFGHLCAPKLGFLDPILGCLLLPRHGARLWPLHGCSW